MIESESALIVIDVQNEFVNGLPEEMQAQQVVENAKKVLNSFRKAGVPIIHFREMHRKSHVDFGRELDGTEEVHAVEGTKAADYYRGMEPLEKEYQIVKRRYSGFFATDLNILLQGLKVKRLYMIGLLTDVCVHYTCADAHQYDYYIKVIKEAVGGSSLEAHNAALNAIQYLQSDSVISMKEVCEL